MSNNTVHLSFNKACFTAGELLTGKVVVNVSGDNVPCNGGVSVTLFGSELAQIEYNETRSSTDSTTGAVRSSTVCRLATGTYEFTRIQASVDSTALTRNAGSGKLARGLYELPFQVSLPPTLPGTIVVTQDTASPERCRIVYSVKAILEGSGRLWNYHTEQEVDIQSNYEQIPRTPTIWGDTQLDTHRSDLVHFLGWFQKNKGGSFYRSVQVDNTQLQGGDTCTIRVAYQNETACPLVSIQATLYQYLEWRTQHPSYKRSYTQAIGWMALELPSSPSATKTMNDDGNDNKKDNNNKDQQPPPKNRFGFRKSGTISKPPIDSSPHVVTGALQVPHGYRPTYKDGTVMSVRHELDIRLRLQSTFARVRNVTIPIVLWPSRNMTTTISVDVPQEEKEEEEKEEEEFAPRDTPQPSPASTEEMERLERMVDRCLQLGDKEGARQANDQLKKLMGIHTE